MAQRRKLHDAYFRQAKAEGYAARSAYKLQQINDRHRLIRPGDRVLDLGCAPGSWLQVAAELVGPAGRVVGLDLQSVTIDLPPIVRTLVGDAFCTPPEVFAAALAPAAPPFDVLLSDMAPSTTGAPGSADHFRSVALCRRVLELAPGLLRPGGSLVMKVFEGEEYPALLRETTGAFDLAKGHKPDATRAVSREMYIVGAGFRGRAAPNSADPAPGAARQAGMPPAPRAGWRGSPPGGPGRSQGRAT